MATKPDGSGSNFYKPNFKSSSSQSARRSSASKPNQADKQKF